jgi:hypothetical protein
VTERSLNRSGRQHIGLTGIASRFDWSLSGSDEKTFKCLPRRDPIRASVCQLVLASVGQLGCPQMTIETKEELRLGFGKVGQRDKSTKRQKIKENYLFRLGWLPQSAVAPCIYRVWKSCPSRTHQIYLYKFKSD